MKKLQPFAQIGQKHYLRCCQQKKERENADQELSKAGDAQKAAMLLKTKEAGYAVIRHALSQAHMPEAVDTILAFALTMRKKRMGHHS